MPFFSEVFSSKIIKKIVLDPKGEKLGRVKDLMIIEGSLTLFCIDTSARNRLLYLRRHVIGGGS